MSLDAWLTVLHASYTGASGIRSLLGSDCEVSDLLELSRHDLVSAGLESTTVERLINPDDSRLDVSREWLQHDNRSIVTLDDPDYPPLLKSVADPPLALWIEGTKTELLRAPQLAMVGSRNPTRGGVETAERFARYLSDHGLTITSGLAIGIDSACHRGGLNGAAGTIAVLGSSLDQIYPATNRDLANRIAADGLLVSEYPPATAARSIHFPQRNRIIAALSTGTFVVEAARRSGSLITARLAAEYGREVFAMPGSIHSPLARGCHRLIKDGAKLVEDASDVLVELAAILQLDKGLETESEPSMDSRSALTEQPGYSELLRAMDFEPCKLEDISARTGLTTAELSSMLLLLELEGFVEALPGGRYSRLPKRTA